MVDCNYCEEKEATYYTEYELINGAIHHDNLCKECVEQVIDKEIVIKLYMRSI